MLNALFHRSQVLRVDHTAEGVPREKPEFLHGADDEERALINQEHLRRLEVIEGLSVNYESIFYVDMEEEKIRPYRLSGRTEAIFTVEELALCRASSSSCFCSISQRSSSSTRRQPRTIWEARSFRPTLTKRTCRYSTVPFSTLLDMIDKVLKLSWIDSNEARAEETPFSLWEALNEVWAFLLPQAEEKGLDFTLDCSQVTHDLVLGDREKLGQLVMYLVNNAVTYTRSGGSVRLSAISLMPMPVSRTARR